MKRLLLAILVLIAAAPAFAWGEKGHYIVNEAATLGLPTDMPPFFYKAFPDLVWLAYDPDRQRGGGASLDAANPPNHFLDYEFTAGLTLPADRYKFIELMTRSGRLEQKAITNSEAGFLPWQIAEEAQRLLVEFRLWRASVPGSSDRAIIERDIIHIAGVLGHFAGDSSNPHHTTIDFNGWIEPNPNGYANDCGTHSRFETAFISRAVTTANVTPKLAAPKLRTDFFAAAVEQVQASNHLVERLYQIDKDGGFNPIGPIKPVALEFASDRLAAGASFLRDLWWSAWVNSAQPPKRSSGD
ncbi:MAG TPA: hypothetical protein VFN10_05090 [Thermoanaerobaculia bacterium]|nr:hypothetical protein [Thermoanaerobaculia bacterium]